MSHLANIVKDNILRLLDEKGISRADLARRINVSPPNIASLLNGDREVQTDTIQKIADALGVNSSELVVEHEHAH